MSLHSINRARPRKPWQWIDIRGRRAGMWAFALNRLTGIGLVIYLYLHFVMLSQLLQGRAAYDGFVALAHSPVVLTFDVVLFAGLIIHGLNGIRVALNGFGIGVRQQKAFFYGLMAIGAVLLAISAYVIFTI
jgi:succinate dehydrogenase / fumarate reductase cytochrome b subunit